VRLGLTALAVGAAIALSGCGDRRPAPPDITTPRPPVGTRPVAYPQFGVTVSVPSNWRSQQGAAPLVASITSGTATVAIWRYPRSEPLPTTAKALRTAKAALVRAARKRDRTLKLTRAAVVRFHGHPALLLVGTETVGSERRMVRSTHIFRDRSEVVVEALAPPAAFAALQRTVFAPLLRSLKISPVRR
jgi:hypothetical protein